MPQRPAMSTNRPPGETLPSETLSHAAHRKDLAACRLWLTAGADPNTRGPFGVTALMEFAVAGHVAGCNAFLDAGADVMARDGFGRTPLHHATAADAHAPLCRVLLERGADGNAQGHDGSTPLHEAAYSGHLAIALTLLPHCDPSRLDAKGRSAAEIAQARGHADLASAIAAHAALRQVATAERTPAPSAKALRVSVP